MRAGRRVGGDRRMSGTAGGILHRLRTLGLAGGCTRMGAWDAG